MMQTLENDGENEFGSVNWEDEACRRELCGSYLRETLQSRLVDDVIALVAEYVDDQTLTKWCGLQSMWVLSEITHRDCYKHAETTHRVIDLFTTERAALLKAVFSNLDSANDRSSGREAFIACRECIADFQREPAEEGENGKKDTGNKEEGEVEMEEEKEEEEDGEDWGEITDQLRALQQKATVGLLDSLQDILIEMFESEGEYTRYQSATWYVVTESPCSTGVAHTDA